MLIRSRSLSLTDLSVIAIGAMDRRPHRPSVTIRNGSESTDGAECLN